MGKIADIEIRDLANRLLESGIRLLVSSEAKRLIISGGNPKFGARPLKGAIRKYIEDPVTEYIIANNLLYDRDSEVKPHETTLKVGLSADGQSTCIYSDEVNSSEIIRPKEDAEAEVQKALDDLYADSFKPHLINQVDEYAK